MYDTCSLQSFYLQQIGNESPCFEGTVHQFLDSNAVFSKDVIEGCVWHEPLFSEEKAIENWKQLLAVSLLCDLAQLHQSDISAKIRLFERQPWNQRSQYFRALVALNHALAKMPIPEVGTYLLESGAALLELKEYCPWLSLPFTPHHFEFGIFLCLLALLTKRQDLQEIVLQLAHWQINTLDATALPLAALFVREKEGNSFQNLCLSYLLFRSAAILSENTPFAAIAQVTMKCIEERLEREEEKIDPLWPLIEKWLDQYKILSHASLSLPELIYDPSTALVGYRSSSQHVICTLHGGYTGLGTLRLGGVEILNYGPQYLPLGECQGFGIEGNSLSDHGMRRSIIEWRRHAFNMKGCIRMVDQPSHSSFERGQFRGIWLEVVQEFKKPHFYLKTNFLGLDGWESVAFSFFVKATRCLTQSQQYLLPRTLERFEGPAQNLIFEDGEIQLELRSLSFKGTMQVIPLAGGNNFWGADFLVAYLLSSEQRQYQWHVGPPRPLADR
jgi:hypothetical protein